MFSHTRLITDVVTGHGTCMEHANMKRKSAGETKVKGCTGWRNRNKSPLRKTEPFNDLHLDETWMATLPLTLKQYETMAKHAAFDSLFDCI